jgi:sugar phosphate isomerase/epimerase
MATAVNLALTPDIRWDIDVADLAQETRTAGFTSLGCPATRAGIEARAAYDAAHLRCHELMALIITENPDKTIAYAARLAEAAAVMRAPWITTVFQAPPTGESVKVTARCAAMFAEVGSAMAVEFNPLGPVPSIAAGLHVVDLARSGAGLLIDSWHFSFGPSTWEDLEAVPIEKIAYIQFDDAPEPVSDDLETETMNRRVLPGHGTLELRRFASTLRRKGFAGDVSIEVLSTDLRRLPIPEFLRRAIDATRPYWS